MDIILKIQSVRVSYRKNRSVDLHLLCNCVIESIEIFIAHADSRSHCPLFLRNELLGQPGNLMQHIWGERFTPFALFQDQGI